MLRRRQVLQAIPLCLLAMFVGCVDGPGSGEPPEELISHPPQAPVEPNPMMTPPEVPVEPHPRMTAIWHVQEGTLEIYRLDQLVAVFERDTQPGVRSIGACFTALYAPGRNRNLLRDSSCLVPPQIVVRINDEFNRDTCSNEPNNISYCDYFAHHGVEIDLLQDSGDAVRFRVRSRGATQHFDQGTPIGYSTTFTVTVPFDEHTVIQYDVETVLTQPLRIGHALRPWSFLELVNQPYERVSYLDANCNVVTTLIPVEPVPNEVATVFVRQAPTCQERPWIALYNNREAGNIGMIMHSWAASHGGLSLLAATEISHHPRMPNAYFQVLQSDDPLQLFEAGAWRGRVIFLAYNPTTSLSCADQICPRRIAAFRAQPTKGSGVLRPRKPL